MDVSEQRSTKERRNKKRNIVPVTPQSLPITLSDGRGLDAIADTMRWRVGTWKQIRCPTLAGSHKSLSHRTGTCQSPQHASSLLYVQNRISSCAGRLALQGPDRPTSVRDIPLFMLRILSRYAVTLFAVTDEKSVLPESPSLLLQAGDRACSRETRQHQIG